MTKVLIIDDEPLALDILENYIDRIPDLQLVARCDNAIDANEIIQKFKTQGLTTDSLQ